MGLPIQSMKKLLREHFPGEASIHVEPGKHEQLGKEIRQRLERFDGVDPNAHSYYHHLASDKEKIACSFTLDDSSPYSYSNDRFDLLVSDADELVLRYDGERDTTPVGSLEELDSFIRACRRRYERRKALAAKRQMVRDLKAHAIIARVKKLAKEIEFDFMTETDHQKLKLFVRLSKDHAVVIDIPFNQFEETLPRVREMICSIREVYNTGIRFRVVTRAKWRWRSEWISHKDC